MAGAGLELPPGFRFHPTDEELVMHYLCRKCASQPIAVPIIADIDLYKVDPWDLPGVASYGEKEWYFFSPRDRKYPNGSRPNRAAGSGYWKATGADKPIGKPRPVGIKKALVFYSGKAPKGEKTNWIMHEYRLVDVDRSAHKKNSLRLDGWVLCRIYNKKGAIDRQGDATGRVKVPSVEDESLEDTKPDMLAMATRAGMASYFDNSDSVPRLQTDSSCSEQVVSPEFNTEVQSEPKPWTDWPASTASSVPDPVDAHYPYNYIDASMDSTFVSQFFQGNNNNQMSPLQDMFMYSQKPF